MSDQPDELREFARAMFTDPDTQAPAPVEGADPDPAAATRRVIALEHNLPAWDAALLDTITDEADMRSLAARLAHDLPALKQNHVRGEGHNPESRRPSGLRDMVRELFGNGDA